MRKYMMLVLSALLLASTAVAEVDQARLTQGLDCTQQMMRNGVDTIIRMNNQPYIGTADAADCELVAYVDYADMPNMNGVFVRLMVSLITPEALYATEMTVACADGAWTFEVWPEVDEYDTTYYEDYAVCLSDEGMALLKALARGKGEATITLRDEERAISGTVPLPKEDMADLYDRFQAAGGLEQDFTHVREAWPVQKEGR